MGNRRSMLWAFLRSTLQQGVEVYKDSSSTDEYNIRLDSKAREQLDKLAELIKQELLDS